MAKTQKCEFCSGSLAIPIARDQDGGLVTAEIKATINFEPGYGSDRDGEKHNYHICENCFESYIMPKVQRKGTRQDQA